MQVYDWLPSSSNALLNFEHILKNSINITYLRPKTLFKGLFLNVFLNFELYNFSSSWCAAQWINDSFKKKEQTDKYGGGISQVYWSYYKCTFCLTLLYSIQLFYYINIW